MHGSLKDSICPPTQIDSGIDLELCEQRQFNKESFVKFYNNILYHYENNTMAAQSRSRNGPYSARETRLTDSQILNLYGQSSFPGSRRDDEDLKIICMHSKYNSHTNKHK